MLYNSPLVSQRSRTLSLSGSNNVAPHSSSGASRSKKKQSPANRKSVFTILKHVFDPFILLQFVMNRKVHQQVMHQQDHSLKFEELEPPAPVIALWNVLLDPFPQPIVRVKSGNALSVWRSAPATSTQNCCRASTVRAWIAYSSIYALRYQSHEST